MQRPSDRDEIRNIVRAIISRGQQETGGSAPSIQAQPGVNVEATKFDESLKDVITEADLSGVPENATLIICVDAIVTPLAQDVIARRAIVVERKSRSVNTGRTRIIALGADHGGFEMKERLKGFLRAKGYQCRDFGTDSPGAVDYPDFSHAVARAVADGGCDLGIILDGAGIGSCMTANKVPGIRAAMCYDVASARNSREHNYANVLTLGAKMLAAERIEEVVEAWLETEYGEERHGKRVAKITSIEKQYSK